MVAAVCQRSIANSRASAIRNAKAKPRAKGRGFRVERRGGARRRQRGPTVTGADETAQKFWTKYFVSKDHVSWAEFVDKFFHYFQVPVQERENNFKALKAVVVEGLDKPGDQTVSIEQFGKVADWFGPCTVYTMQLAGNGFLDRIRKLLFAPWFHGDIDTSECDRRLQDKPVGTFLIRFSDNIRGCFAIGYVDRKGTISRGRIQYDSKQQLFKLNTLQVPTMEEILKEIENTGKVQLKTCSGSKYPAYFEGTEKPSTI